MKATTPLQSSQYTVNKTSRSDSCISSLLPWSLFHIRTQHGVYEQHRVCNVLCSLCQPVSYVIWDTFLNVSKPISCFFFFSHSSISSSPWKNYMRPYLVHLALWLAKQKTQMTGRANIVSFLWIVKSMHNASFCSWAPSIGQNRILFCLTFWLPFVSQHSFFFCPNIVLWDWHEQVHPILWCQVLVMSVLWNSQHYA